MWWKRCVIFAATIITPGIQKGEGQIDDEGPRKVGQITTAPLEMDTGDGGSTMVGQTIQVVPVSTARPATETIHTIVQRGLDDDDMESAAAGSRDEEVDTKIDIYHIGGSEVVSQVN